MSKRPNCNRCRYFSTCNSRDTNEKNKIAWCAIWNKEHGIYNEPGKPKLILENNKEN